MEKFLESQNFGAEVNEKIRKMDKRTQKTMMESWVKKNLMTQHSGSESDAQHWVNQLKSAKSPDTANQLCLKFIPAIKDSGDRFIRKFCKAGGLSALIEFTNFSAQRKQLRRSFLEIVKAFLDAPNDVGFLMVTEHSHMISAIVNTYETKDDDVKRRCLQIMCFLCWWKSASYEEVVSGMCMLLCFRHLLKKKKKSVRGVLCCS